MSRDYRQPGEFVRREAAPRIPITGDSPALITWVNDQGRGWVDPDGKKDDGPLLNYQLNSFI